MRELATCGNIEDDVIGGLWDWTINKSIWYGSTNLTDFKERLKCYEIMQEKAKPQNDFKRIQPAIMQRRDVKKELCSNCGERGHNSKNCSNKDKGAKCFNCNNFGHISKQCPLRLEKANVRHLIADYIMYRRIRIKFYEQWLALFDSGSKYNIVSEKVYKALHWPKFDKSNIYLIGFGNNANNNEVKFLGNFTCKVVIDDEMYDLTFHIVQHILVDVDVILGKKFCPQIQED